MGVKDVNPPVAFEREDITVQLHIMGNTVIVDVVVDELGQVLQCVL